MNPLDLVRPDLAGFVPYASARRVGTPAAVCLDANESPWSPPGDPSGLNRYPSPQPAALLTSLADLYGVEPDQLFVGRGSDEAIDLLIRAFCRAGIDNIVTVSPTFGMYAIAARVQGAQCRTVPVDAEAGFALSVDDVMACVDEHTRLVFLCSPNNPTGTDYHALIRPLAEALAGRALLVVDEAYIEYADDDSATSLLDAFPHLAILRTLSKAYALAGARIGSLIAASSVIRLIAAIAPPYPLPTPCVEAAQAALSAAALATVADRIAVTRDERQRLYRAMSNCAGVLRVWPGQGNFLLVRLGCARTTYNRLLAHGILVRDMSAQPGLAGCLRIGIGLPAENDRVLAVLQSPSAGVAA